MSAQCLNSHSPNLVANEVSVDSHIFFRFIALRNLLNIIAKTSDDVGHCFVQGRDHKVEILLLESLCERQQLAWIAPTHLRHGLCRNEFFFQQHEASRDCTRQKIKSGFHVENVRIINSTQRILPLAFRQTFLSCSKVLQHVLHFREQKIQNTARQF